MALISSREKVFFFLAAIFAASILSKILVPVAVGLTFAYISEIPLTWLRKRFRVHREASEWALAYAFVIACVSMFLFPLLFVVYIALVELFGLFSGPHATGDSSFPGILNQAGMWIVGHLETYGVKTNLTDLVDRMRVTAASIAQTGLQQIGSILQATPSVLFNGAIIFITWVYFSVRGAGYRARLLPRIIPWERERAILASTTGSVLRSVIVANVVVSMTQATIITLLLAALNIPKFYLWGTMSFFMSFVPVLGTGLVTVSVAAYCWFEGRPWAAAIMLIGAVMVALLDNILRPLFMKGSSALSFFWVFIAFVGGIAQFGLAGTVLGPLAFALFVAALEAWEKVDDIVGPNDLTQNGTAPHRQ